MSFGIVPSVSKIPEATVAAVVGDVSEHMSDPHFAQLAIGGFAQSHPDVGRFITAHLRELGSGEAVMHAVFHAEVLGRCFEKHGGRPLDPIGYVVLDAVAKGDTVEAFTRSQPALASYVASNVESDPMRRLLSLVGLAMDRMA